MPSEEKRFEAVRRIPPLRRTLGSAFTAATLAGAAAAAAEPPACPERPPVKPDQLQVFIENDLLGGTDRYYTNGIKIGLGVPVLIDAAMRAARGAVLDADSAERCVPVEVGLFLGQNLYTPRHIDRAVPQPFDRPWAAWLYLGGVAQTVRGNRLDTLEIDIGTVGPAALGRQVQTQWHELVGAPEPKGWAFQLPNEPAFLVSWLHKRRYDHGRFDVIPHAGVTLGTVTTLARAGATVRFGRNMTGFGPDTIEPGGAMLNATRRWLGEPARGWEWYVFGGADLRLVGYNIFLDGTVFHDSPSVDRQPVVYDLRAGISVRYERLRISLTHVHRSEEFTTAVGGGGAQNFDSLNISFEW